LPGFGFWKLKNSWAIAHFAGFIGCTALVLWTRLSFVWILATIIFWLFSQLHVQTSFQPEVNEALFTIEQLQGA